jgi:hypothetical protein
MRILRKLDATEKALLRPVLTGRTRMLLNVKPDEPCRIELVGIDRRLQVDRIGCVHFEEDRASERSQNNPKLLDAEASDANR